MPRQALIPAALWRLALGALLLATTWLSLVPRPPPIADTGWDKANHLLGFAALAFCAWHAVAGARARALLALLVYGGLIEVAQYFLPPRTAEWGDLLADALGLAVGALLAAALARLRRAG